jgi:cytochrome P450
MTFINGSHACIGYRFALMETKIILHQLLSTFAFQLAVDPADVGKKGTGIILRPCLKAQRDKDATLPMLVKVASPE